MSQNKNSGFALVALLIVIAIIAILFVVMNGKKGDNSKTLIQTNNQAKQDINQANENLLREQNAAQEQMNGSGQ